MAIPDAASYQAIVGELAWHGAVEVGGIVDGAEGLVLASNPEIFVESPSRREELKLGETDGCGQICGTSYNGDSLPCGDGAALSCDPNLPAISCVEGSWSFAY